MDLPVTRARCCPTKHAGPETMLINIGQLEFNQPIELGLGIGEKPRTRNTCSIEEINEESLKTGRGVRQRRMQLALPLTRWWLDSEVRFQIGI